MGNTKAQPNLRLSLTQAYWLIGAIAYLPFPVAIAYRNRAFPTEKLI
ncbi:hypothetical protein [Nostoc sphaeroides]|nr:hypothetical protein [Nostoc sphaeroides]MCC5628583.1 hypothetical protein [Nostoc sphaeroides CHAB 2801]